MTPAEKILWKILRNRRFRGYKFLRQHPIIYDNIESQPKYFIPDFYCTQKKVIIELDGKIHDFQKDYDERREEILINMGLRIIRFKNEELKNLNALLKKLEDFMKIKEEIHPTARRTSRLSANRKE